jgi:quercetin dioxygenase-like cupin family protein
LHVDDRTGDASCPRHVVEGEGIVTVGGKEVDTIGPGSYFEHVGGLLHSRG